MSEHRYLRCLVNRLLRRTSKKTSKLCVLLWRERWSVVYPHKLPVTRKMFHVITSYSIKGPYEIHVITRISLKLVIYQQRSDALWNPVRMHAKYSSTWIPWNVRWKANGSWWRHNMGTISALLDLCEGNPPVTGCFFWSTTNKLLNKQSTGSWSGTPWRSCDAVVILYGF